ncbi:cytochrome b/b6 domain-containing protein [Chelativorans sp. SCAU2101]|uniref:Cytochrome b/b6 domain-containing protein n=1 Tax=Chelativorans petroleitrophicus TaxID=2975484 RepID=A0A9X2X5Z4_9HYPH|nr:cytochrome b/b6 domain-containing protein [Chelativorans petroleitrophicus]MCT8988796.1 cytochrome b/b6 domain-containing protein [Chelativorans petroleitrophicus]
MTTPVRQQGVRHRLADRLFHWGMAVTVIVLGATAFLPILGIRFDWVPLHWTFGVLLTVLVLYHLVRVMLVHGVSEMIPGPDDIREIGYAAGGGAPKGLSEAKYDVFQKGFHLAAAICVLTLLATGLLMLAKIDTTFWNRNPAIFTDQTWGVIYVLHGTGALALLFLFILHVYFALLPEHRDFLLAMIHGKGPEKARKGSNA